MELLIFNLVIQQRYPIYPFFLSTLWASRCVAKFGRLIVKFPLWDLR